VNSGIYNLTVYISMLSRDPLLSASVLYFTVNLFSLRNNKRILHDDVDTIEYKVIN